MQAKIGASIVINEPTENLISWCRNNLVIDNPEYHKMISMGRWAGNVPEKIYLYSKNAGSLILPFGCLGNVWGMIKDSPYMLDFGHFKPFDYQSNINLYPYQKDAVRGILRAKNGIVVMPCVSQP